MTRTSSSRSRLAALVVIVLAALVGILLSQTVASAHELGDTEIAIDADPGTAGIQNYRYVGTSGTFTIDVVAEDFEGLGAFNFQVVYGQGFLTSPTISTGPDVDRNPNANQAYLNSTGRSFSCSPPSPSGDTDPSASVGVAFLSCFSTGAAAGPDAPHGSPETIATLTFNIMSPSGGTSLALRNVNMYSEDGTIELASCAPVVTTSALACTGAAISNRMGDTDSDGCTDIEEYGPSATAGGLRDPDDYWDFYDTPNASNVRDKTINIPGDILSVARRFGAADMGGSAPINRNTNPLSGPPPLFPAYHPAFDRGALNGPNAWDRAPADGAINIPNDILGVAAQFGHNCLAAP